MTDQTDPKSPEQPEPAGSESTTASPSTAHDDFARLLAATGVAREPSVGATVRGKVAQLGTPDVLVDIGARSEALIAREELLGPGGDLTVGVGDPIEALVVSVDGAVRLSRRIVSAGRGKDAARELLMEAFRASLPVQGKVTASIKGGYEVMVSGVRGFCPFSQIDVRRQEDPTLYFNKTFDFLIKEYQPRKRNLILSRRALIEADAKKNEVEARSKITEGANLKGTVVSLQEFGAFVDLGSNVQGLLHVSEMSHARVAKPSDLLTVGQEIEVQILKVDARKGKISLTRKPLEADPWAGVKDRFRPGQVMQAKVQRVTDFGAFVELAPGLDGLVHVSELGSRSGGSRPGERKAQDLVKAGDELKVQVLKVEEARKRISLGIASEKSPPGEKVEVKPLKVGEVVTGKVEKVEKFGVFVRIGPGRTGMIPNNELGTPRGSDHRRMFPVGTEMKAEVIQSDPAGRRIRLSVTKAENREEREALDRYRKEASRSGSSSLSTMADAFQALKKSTPAGGGKDGGAK